MKLTNTILYGIKRYLALVSVFLLPVASTAQEGTPVPLNTNGSFETSEVGVISNLAGVEGWFLELLSGGAAEFAIVDTEAQHGDKSLRITISNAGTQAWHVQAVGDEIPVDPQATYRFSVWAKAANAGAQAAFTFGNYDFNEYGALRNNITLSTEWQEFSFEFSITDTQIRARAPIHFGYAANVGNAIYIDNLQIIELEESPLKRRPVVVEATSGELGDDFATLEDDGISYITITTDGTAVGTFTSPGSDNRVARYEVTFPFAGEYNLFLRGRVGPNTFDDDSFFYPISFGEMDPTNPDDWTIANGLNAAGFSDPDDFVIAGGGLANNVWKWMNISASNFGFDSHTFVVEENNSTLTFMIGGREDGLDISRLVFGRSDLFFTVDALNRGLAGLTEISQEQQPHAGPPLATGKDKWLGNVYSPTQIPNFTNYWNQVTPENAGKWGSVESNRDVFNWNELDAAYAMAKDNGFPFRFHVLVWGNQQPIWMPGLSSDPETQLAELRQWFEAVAERYPDIDYLEVVNEPINDPPNVDPNDTGTGAYMDALGGSGETGWDWIINAFQMARDIFPSSTKLMINEYGIVSNMTTALRYREIIRLLQDRDLIDGIGVQGHAFSTRGSTVNMRRVLDTLAVTGLPIQVTEMDLDGNPSSSPNVTPEQSDQNQLDAYRRVFPALWEHPAVEGITLWGWRPGLWRNTQEAYLVRNNGSERPALRWLIEYMEAYATNIEDEKLAELPNTVVLHQNYPNPFNPTTRIVFDLPESANVRLQVYDLTGRLVATLVDDMRTAGRHTVRFDASNLASGVYMYRISTGTSSQVKRMTLIK